MSLKPEFNENFWLGLKWEVMAMNPKRITSHDSHDNYWIELLSEPMAMTPIRTTGQFS